MDCILAVAVTSMKSKFPPTQALVTQVSALGSERFELQLDGPLPTGWAGNLAAGLARVGVSIDRGHARGAGAGLWSSRIEVVRTAGAADPRALGIEALATTDSGAGFAAPIELDHFALLPSLEHGGTLQLRLEAADTMGFLAALLRRLAYFALFPVEMRLETRSGRIADEFWLCAGGSRAPSPATADALRAVLRSLVRAQR
jgi:hypothetical protein